MPDLPEEGANPFGKNFAAANLITSLLNVTVFSPSDNPCFHSIFNVKPLSSCLDTSIPLLELAKTC